MSAATFKVEIKGNSFRNLAVFLLVYLVASPFLEPYPSLRVISHLSLTVVLFLSAYAVQKQQGQRPYVFAIIIPLLILYWLGSYDAFSFTLSGAYLLLVVYFGLLIASYIVQIFNSPKVDAKVLYAAFCLYLMVSLLWGAVFALLNQLKPGSFSGDLLRGSGQDSIHVFNYLSIVTLTSLGYGDITPQSIGAATLCHFEAIIGQFFTTVLIAWLVGNYVSSRREKMNGENDGS